MKALHIDPALHSAYIDGTGVAMEKVKVSKSKKNTENAESQPALPSSFKKFRLLPEIEGFYRFVYENDLRKEGKKILERIILQRKAEKLSAKAKRRKVKLNS